MQTPSEQQKNSNVFNIFSGRKMQMTDTSRIVRLAPENDGLCMLYSNSGSNEKLYRMSILCWALREDGSVDALVPWLDRLSPCHLLDNPLDGQWQGYFEPSNEHIFDKAPEHQVSTLRKAAHYFSTDAETSNAVLQEFPDTIGTHALLCTDDTKSITLTEVLSWRLLANGSVQAMIINEDKVTSTPVLAGDAALYPVSSNPHFKFFFQHHIANQIKSHDPETLSAISLLLSNTQGARH